MTENPEDAAAARAAEQARLRKERREAKIRAGGASRLNKISGLGGGLQQDPPTDSSNGAAAPAAAPAPASTPASAPTPAPAQQATIPRPPQHAHADPDEVDISRHFYTPQSTARIPPFQPQFPPPPSDAQLRQLMLGLDSGLGPGLGPGLGGGAPDDDPMLKMMMQMLGGPGGVNPFAPPGLGPDGAANPFAGMGMPPGFPGAGAPQAATAVVPDRYTSLWRLLHTAVALGLGLYIALWTSFGGTKNERERERVAASLGAAEGVDGAEGMTPESARKFFYAFATAEAVLLTTRYFMDRGRSAAAAAGGGLLATVAGFLPPRIRGYVLMGLRYAQIFGTVKADVLVCIFVLGVCSWVRG